MICSERVTPLPLEPDDATPLREIRATPAVSRWWGPPEPELPDDEPEARCFAMLDGEELGGMIHYGEENTSEYSHAKIDYSSTRPAVLEVRKQALSLVAGLGESVACLLVRPVTLLQGTRLSVFC